MAMDVSEAVGSDLQQCPGHAQNREIVVRDWTSRPVEGEPCNTSTPAGCRIGPLRPPVARRTSENEGSPGASIAPHGLPRRAARFGRCVVDARRRMLWRDATPIPLTAKTF